MSGLSGRSSKSEARSEWAVRQNNNMSLLSHSEGWNGTYTYSEKIDHSVLGKSAVDDFYPEALQDGAVGKIIYATVIVYNPNPRDES